MVNCLKIIGGEAMTLVVSWVGIDTKGPGSASAYLTGDSRISWGNGEYFDYASKVFAFNNYPDILGYCGDVLFPSIVLSQITEMADTEYLYRFCSITITFVPRPLSVTYSLLISGKRKTEKTNL